MEPTLPMPQSPESPPVVAPTSTEGAIVAPEAQGVPNPERVGEMHPVGAPPVSSSSTSVPTVQQPQQTVVTQPVASATTPADPMIADDVDVLEKEWVDKAKQIVQATRDDPHQQEKEVSKLQADYLMKRYNKKIKLAE